MGNGSLTLVFVADGYQRIQEPCSANSDFTEDYHLQEMYQSWQIFLDAVDGRKFYLFAFDGSPEPPMRLLSQTMLPARFLRSTTDATTTILKRSNNDVVMSASSALARTSRRRPRRPRPHPRRPTTSCSPSTMTMTSKRRRPWMARRRSAWQGGSGGALPQARTGHSAACGPIWRAGKQVRRHTHAFCVGR